MVGDHDGEVLVRLSRDEALVLFEWLHRAADQDELRTATTHHAELIALESLSALLEAELVEPFAADYANLVAAARRRLEAADG